MVYGGSYDGSYSPYMKGINWIDEWKKRGLTPPVRSKRTTKPAISPGKPGSTFDDLYQQLIASMGGGGYSVPSRASLESQARSSASLTYDPQISALKRAITAATANIDYGKAAVGKLFTGLAQSYGIDKKETKKLFKEAKEGEYKRLKQYTDSIKGNYSASMKNLADTYRYLGIEAAAGPSTTGALAKQQADVLQEATDETNIEQRALGQEELAQQVYWQKGAGTAKMEGTQRQSDLAQMLAAYKIEQQGKIEDLQVQRQIAYQNALSKLQQQVAEQAARQQESTWDKLIQLGRFRMDIGRYNKSMTPSPSSSRYRGLTGANQYLYDQFVKSQWGPSEAERYSGILQGLILQIPAGTSAEEAARLASSEAQRRGISPTVLARAMLAYYGKM